MSNRILLLVSLFLVFKLAIAQNKFNSGNTTNVRNYKLIGLKYTPRETLTPSVKKELWKIPLNIMKVKDMREGKLNVIGETIGESEVFDVRSKSDTSVRSFATKVFKKKFEDWGGKTSTDTYILEPEILQFFVREEDIYSTRFKVRFTLSDKNGNKLWSNVISCNARVSGRSLSEENYNEGFSDVLQEGFVKLFETDDFISAWYGESPQLTAARAVESFEINTLKDQLLLLIKEDFDEQAQLAFVKQRSLSALLTAEQMVEWKHAGIPEVVITEVIRLGGPK